MAELSEAEKVQAKARLVRLDAEGNPVDGTVQYFRVKDLKLIDPEPDTLDDFYRKVFELKQVSITIPLENVSDETLKLLKGEA